MSFKFFSSLLGILAFAITTPTTAQDIWNQDTLSGDWGGNRDRLAKQGIEFEAVYTGEYSKNASGGVREDSVYLDNVDLVMSLDAETLWDWQGASFSLYILGNNGDSPSANVGDAQGVSNIDSPDTWKIYEAWYEQAWLDDKLSTRFGLYDLNSEFDVIETAGLFINSSHGIGPDFSQSGVNGPSIFPTTSVGLRVRGQLTDNTYLQGVILDGVPGDPNNDKGTHIKFDSNDGWLITAELGHLEGGGENAKSPYAKFALGTWYYTEESTTDASGNAISPTNNNGLYVLAEKVVYQEANDSDQGLAVFARYGVADSTVNQFDSYFGAGLAYTGLFPGRDADQLGLAVAIAQNGNEYKTANVPVNDREVIWELTYRAQLTPWLVMQPDIQYVMNPGTDPTLKDARVYALRFEIAF